MTNVLPQQQRKKVWRMYRSRLIIALSLTLLILSAVAYLALVPSSLALRFATPPVNEVDVGHSSGPETAQQVSRAQTLLGIASPILDATSSALSLIEEALSPKPKAVSINHITYNAGESLITLSGSGSRESINSYRDALSKLDTFASVSVPVSALVGAEGGHFSMTLTLPQ